MSLSSFLPVEVSGRIAIALTGTSPPAPALTFGGLDERGGSCWPSSVCSVRDVVGDLLRLCRVATVGCQADHVGAALRRAGHENDESADAEAREPRERPVDDHEAEYSRAARTVGARGSLGLADRAGRVGLDERRRAAVGRRAAVPCSTSAYNEPGGRAAAAAPDRRRELERGPDRLVGEVELGNRDLRRFEKRQQLVAHDLALVLERVGDRLDSCAVRVARLCAVT